MSEWCRNCTFSSSGYDNYVYCNWHKEYMDQYDWCDEWREGESDSGGSGCYIATATLQREQRPFMLAELRKWRGKYMRTHAFGRWLEAKYDNIGPRVVSLIYDSPTLRNRYYALFVNPALQCVQKQQTSRFKPIYTMRVYGIFMLCIITGYIHVLLTRKEQRQSSL